MAVSRGLRRLSVALLTSACFVLTGCGRDSSPEAAPSGLDPLQPSMPAGLASPTAGTSLNDAKALISMPWKLAAISTDRRTITVRYLSGDGSCLSHVGYQLTVDGQAIRLGEYSQTSTDAACPAMLTGGIETVALPMALEGSVQLIHVPASRDWPAE